MLPLRLSICHALHVSMPLQPILMAQPDGCVADIRQEGWQDDFAFLVKTGSLTAQSRVPIQLLTFLSGIQNFILVGAQEGKWSLLRELCVIPHAAPIMQRPAMNMLHPQMPLDTSKS